MYTLTKNLLSIFVTDLEQTSFFLIFDLSINNLLFFRTSKKVRYLAKSSGNIFFRRSSLYQTTKWGTSCFH